MKQKKLLPEEQLESDKKHFTLIALNYRPCDIALKFGISETDEGNNRKKLYLAYGIQNGRDVTVYALKHGLIKQQEANDTLAPETKIVNWATIKNIT